MLRILSLIALIAVFNVPAYGTTACTGTTLNAPPYINTKCGTPVFNFVVVNSATSLVTTAMLNQIFAAIQTQVTNHFAPYYGVNATFTISSNGTLPTPLSNNIPVFIVNTLVTPEAGAIAFHYVQNSGDPVTDYIKGAPNLPNGLPYVVIPMGTKTSGYGVYWASLQMNESLTQVLSEAISHEVLETLGNQVVSDYVIGGGSNYILFCEHEVCDPVEFQNGYTINGVAVSNFVLPNYWNPMAATSFGQYDYLNTIKSPLTPYSGEQGFLYFASNGSSQSGSLVSNPSNPKNVTTVYNGPIFGMSFANQLNSVAANGLAQQMNAWQRQTRYLFGSRVRAQEFEFQA